MGWENLFHCEWNEFGQKVLSHYWPNAELFNDITKSDFKKYANRIDVLSGGFPCQPYSTAGKRLGKEDERHLWPEMLRAIQEIAPRWVVGENVRGLTNWNGGLVFDEVCSDLEACGYEVQPFLLPAVAVNAPHRRDRVWFVARYKTDRLTQSTGIDGRKEHIQNNRSGIWTALGTDGIIGNATDANGFRLEQRKDGGEMDGGQREMEGEGSEFTNATQTNGEIKNSSNTNGFGLERGMRQNGGKSSVSTFDATTFDALLSRTNWENFPTQPPICSGDDGVSNRLDGITFSKWRKESIKAYGNAVVPQVVHQIFKAIEQYEKL